MHPTPIVSRLSSKFELALARYFMVSLEIFKVIVETLGINLAFYVQLSWFIFNICFQVKDKALNEFFDIDDTTVVTDGDIIRLVENPFLDLFARSAPLELLVHLWHTWSICLLCVVCKQFHF